MVALKKIVVVPAGTSQPDQITVCYMSALSVSISARPGADSGQVLVMCAKYFKHINGYG